LPRFRNSGYDLKMSPRLRLVIAGTIGSILAVVGAIDIADERLGFVALIAICAFWVFFQWRAGAPPEAWIMAVVIFGYIVGNRGFAQFLFSPRVPLLPAEAALLFCTVGLGIRATISKTSIIVFDAVNLSILLWAVYATLRLPLDLNTYGIMALRDYALVYYSVFFFLGQYLCRDPSSARLIDLAFTVSFLVLPIVVIIDKISPGFFAQNLKWDGTPLIYHKSDLISASLICGSFWSWSRFERSKRRFWLFSSAVSLLLVGIEESPRAALVAAAVATIAWASVRRFRLIGFQIAVVAVGIAVSLPLEIISGTQLAESKSYEMFERVVSLVDWSGSHAYQNAESANTIDNNQFRRVWWNAVVAETVAGNPVFGLGFGYDLAARFLADYNWLSVEEEFTTRSPHSVIVTNFGRLGGLGLGLFLLGAAMAARSGIRAFRITDFEAMAWWSVVIILGVSACFGVVLEAPMGAVVFWVALGFAHQKTSAAKGAMPELGARDDS